MKVKTAELYYLRWEAQAEGEEERYSSVALGRGLAANRSDDLNHDVQVREERGQEEKGGAGG